MSTASPARLKHLATNFIYRHQRGGPIHHTSRPFDLAWPPALSPRPGLFFPVCPFPATALLKPALIAGRLPSRPGQRDGWRARTGSALRGNPPTPDRLECNPPLARQTTRRLMFSRNRLHRQPPEIALSCRNSRIAATRAVSLLGLVASRP
jgi:hypothetical protein